MRRTCVLAVVVALAAGACHRQPKAVIEYGETVTYTSTASDPAPQPVASAPVGTTAAAPVAAPVPADDASATAAAETPEPAAAANEGEWTTSVQTATPPPTAPAVAAPPAKPAEPSEPSPPPAPRQWYKAKPW